MTRIHTGIRYLLETSRLRLLVSGCSLAALKASSLFFMSVILFLIVFVFSFSSSSCRLACRWLSSRESAAAGSKGGQKYYSNVSDPGSGAFFLPLKPGSGMSKKHRIRISDEQPGSYFRELINNFLG
jgi:hypothetical protein